MSEATAPQKKLRKDPDITKFFIPFARSKSQKRPASTSSRSSSLKQPTVSPLSTPHSNYGARNVLCSQSPTSAVKANGAASIPYRSPRPKVPAVLKLEESLSSSNNDTSDKEVTYQRSGVAKRRRTLSPPPQPGSPDTMPDVVLSTQSVVRDGKVVAVRDSDEDDTDSLQSLDDIIGSSTRVRAGPASISEDVDMVQNETERRSLLSTFAKGRAEPLLGKQKVQALRNANNSKRFDISELIREQERAEDIRRDIEKAKAGFVETEAELEKAADLELSKVKLQAMIGASEQDDDDMNRLMHAMERTEALSSDPLFSFFGAGSLQDWHERIPEQSAFPYHVVPEGFGELENEHDLRTAYTTGFMAEMARTGRLPDELMTWTFDTVLLDSDDEMRAAKVSCLRHNTTAWTRTTVTAQHVQTAFETLGGSAESLRDHQEIEANHQPLREGRISDPKLLLSVVELFYHICQDMDFAALSKLVSLTCRLALDSRLTANIRVTHSVERLLGRLLDMRNSEIQEHVTTRIIHDITANLRTPVLQAQLLKHIVPTSAAASAVRVTLAASFLLGTRKEPHISLDLTTNRLDRLAQHIADSPDFDTTVHERDRPINYTTLLSLTQILDVAISDGGRPAIFPSKVEEQAFNASIDKLANSIKNTFTSIADSGATHMRRAEAKEALQIVYWRLLYAVRTEPRPKKTVFDSAGNLVSAHEFRERERTKEFMANFVRKKQAALSDERRPERLSSDPSQLSESEVLIRSQLGLA